MFKPIKSNYLCLNQSNLSIFVLANKIAIILVFPPTKSPRLRSFNQNALFVFPPIKSLFLFFSTHFLILCFNQSNHTISVACIQIALYMFFSNQIALFVFQSIKSLYFCFLQSNSSFCVSCNQIAPFVFPTIKSLHSCFLQSNRSFCFSSNQIALFVFPPLKSLY